VRPSSELDPTARTVTILAGAFAVSVFLFMTVAAVLVAGGIFAEGNQAILELLPVLGITLLALPLAAPVVGTKIIEAAGDTGDETGGDTVDEVLQGWSQGHVVAMAMREGMGLTGITLALVAGSVPWIVGFGAVSLATILLGWPRRSELEERVRRARR